MRQNLPESLILNSSEQAEVRRHIDELAQFLRLDRPMMFRGQMMSQDAAIGAIIASLLIKGGQRMDQAMSDVLTDDYLDALEDMPAWAVREALRRWNRRESIQLDSKNPHNFVFAPKAPILRALADHERVRVQFRIRQLQRLCDAVPTPEFSDDHREDMIKRVQAVIRSAVMPDEPAATMPAQPASEAAE